MVLHLPAREPRWRVVEVRVITDAGYVFTGEVQERKTFEGAEALRQRWAQEGRKAVVQGGIVEWIPADKWEETWQATDFIESQNYPPDWPGNS